MLAVIGLIVGIWVPLIGIAAAIGLVGLMIGAIVSRVRAKQGVGGIAIDVVIGAMAAATAYFTWLGR